jgi:hypothetical protein
LAQKNLDRLVTEHKSLAQYRIAKYQELAKVIVEKLNTLNAQDCIRAKATIEKFKS